MGYPEISHLLHRTRARDDRRRPRVTPADRSAERADHGRQDTRQPWRQHQVRAAHRRRQELRRSRSTRARSAPTSSTSPSSTRETGIFTYDPGFTSTASCESQDHLYRRRRRHPALPRLSDRAARRARRLPRDLLPAALRRTADHGAEGGLRLPRHPPHDGARADEPLLPGLPPRRASDGGDGRLRRRALGLLSRLHRHLRSAPAHDRLDPHDRQDADARRDGLQVFDRPAVRVSAERPRLRHQLPAHVLRGAVRGVQAEPGAGARDGPHLHPARRPRAERLDLDGAARRLLGRQPVRLHRGRHRLPVGPGAWRRQRGGAEDAAPRSARSTASRNTSSARRTRTTRSA